MKKKKQNLKVYTRKCVFYSYGIQIASILTFYMVYFVFKCFFAKDTFVEQLLLSAITEVTICYMAYKRAWSVGDFHAGEVLTTGALPKKRQGLVIGLLMVAPIVVCMLFSSLLQLMGVNLGFFETVLNLFVFRWSGVLEYITRWTEGSAVIGLLFYALGCVPLVLTGYYGFKNGFLGVYEGIRLKARHCPRYENEGARELWNKA